jgi:hypothetical protein
MTFELFPPKKTVSYTLHWILVYFVIKVGEFTPKKTLIGRGPNKGGVGGLSGKQAELLVTYGNVKSVSLIWLLFTWAT